MRTKTTAVLMLVAVWFTGAAPRLSAADKPKTTTDKKPIPAKDANVPERYVLASRAPYFGTITKVTADGSVHVKSIKDAEKLPPVKERLTLAKGDFVGIVSVSPDNYDDNHLVRVAVVEIEKNGGAKLQVSKSAAAQIKPGELFALTRCVGATAAQLKALPEICPIEEREADELTDSSDADMSYKTWKNLKAIGKALEDFYDLWGRYPPAVLNGPDGKPWHSWRMLIVPYLDSGPLYLNYKWDEPWDGPGNRKLWSSMPKAYSDPLYGENKEYYTHYVALVGEGAALPAKGAKVDLSISPNRGTGGRSVDEFADALSSTLVVGQVGADRKIPWMKPEDIDVSVELPPLGQPGNFALPYKTAKGLGAAPFLRGDGSTIAILDGVDGGTWKALVTIAGHEVVDWTTIPHIAGLKGRPPRKTRSNSPIANVPLNDEGAPAIPPPAVANQKLTSVVYLFRREGGAKAYLVQEDVERKK